MNSIGAKKCLIDVGTEGEIYSLSFVPFDPRPFDALWIVAVALAVSLAASYAPARAASTTDPVEILRNQ